MTTLYLVRHAWAGERDPARWPDDGLRPLTEGGRMRFGRFIRKLAKRGVEPRLIITSPLVRCRQTAELLRKALPLRPAVVERQELAPGGDFQALARWSADQAGDLAWVGHAPDVEIILAQFIGNGAAAIAFGKGSVAAIEFPQAIELGQGQLKWLVTAKMLNVE